MGETIRARMKKLIEELRFAQMRVRMDVASLKRSKQAVRHIAEKMRELQKEKQRKGINGI